MRREHRKRANATIRHRLALVLAVLVVAFAGAACSGGGGTVAPTTPQLTSTPMGNSFVEVTGSGFPRGIAAVVTGVAGSVTNTVDVTTDTHGHLLTSVQIPDGYQGAMTLRAKAGTADVSSTSEVGNSDQQPADDSGVRPLAPVNCTITADVGAVPAAAPGDVVCLTGDLSSRMTLSTSGTENAPITYTGGGKAKVQGIDVTADNVVVQGFISAEAHSMGAKLTGNNIVFQDNKIDHPVYSGDDTDGLRFFGDDISMLHNTISDVSDGSDCDDSGCGDGPHPDCFQTYYSDSYPTSSTIRIEGNRCEDVAAQCLIGEGPQLPADGINGPGKSAGWTFYDNYCKDGAAQAIMLRDIENATIVGNEFDGDNNKAIALQAASTGAHVGGNKLNSQIAKLITFDDPNVAPGYVGPTPDPS